LNNKIDQINPTKIKTNCSHIKKKNSNNNIHTIIKNKKKLKKIMQKQKTQKKKKKEKSYLDFVMIETEKRKKKFE
jgi:G3E family GTPase